MPQDLTPRKRHLDQVCICSWDASVNLRKKKKIVYIVYSGDVKFSLAECHTERHTEVSLIEYVV